MKPITAAIGVVFVLCVPAWNAPHAGIRSSPHAGVRSSARDVMADAQLSPHTVQDEPRAYSHAAPSGPQAFPHNAQTQLVQQYLDDLQHARYAAAYQLLNGAAHAYYRNAPNFASVYAADAYRITSFVLVGARGDERQGRVFFARETARFRDHAHDVELTVTATVPVGVIPEQGRWRIKDPGHPWRAFAVRASASANGVRVTVKKLSFFARRIEAVVSFANAAAGFVTVLPYGRSVLRDGAGHVYRPIETRDWSLTDRTLFEGLRLAPNAQYTGTLAFECPPLDDAKRTFALTVAPLLADGAGAPFSIDVDAIAGPAADPARDGAPRAE